MGAHAQPEFFPLERGYVMVKLTVQKLDLLLSDALLKGDPARVLFAALLREGHIEPGEFQSDVTLVAAEVGEGLDTLDGGPPHPAPEVEAVVQPSWCNDAASRAAQPPDPWTGMDAMPPGGVVAQLPPTAPEVHVPDDRDKKAV